MEHGGAGNDFRALGCRIYRRRRCRIYRRGSLADGRDGARQAVGGTSVRGREGALPGAGYRRFT